MRRKILLPLVPMFCMAMAVGLLAGCKPQSAGPRQVAVPPDDPSNGPIPPVLHVPPPVNGPAAAPGAAMNDILAAAGQPTRQDQIAAAVMNALDLLDAKKYAEALAALEAAKQAATDAGQDAGAIERQISRVKETMARSATADATVQNIRGVLDDGRAEEASRLAADALAQYGGSDAAADLLKLKREADALVAAQAGAAGQRNLRDEAKADLDAGNLRAAAAALEQAAAMSDDADLKTQAAGLRQRLSDYDDNRRRAEELRRDPAALDDAVAALQEAQKAWDTPDVQQQIAEYQLALQNRRDRLGVADFEVRGDVGVAGAGGALADDLLPAFKSRFDLVERGQLNKVVDELKLEANGLNAGANQGEIGRLVRLRYLVVGSITRLSGVTVNARLVDVRTGLVVQTARIAAPTMEDLTPLLPQLAAVLMMTDEQKLAYEQQQAQLAAALPTPAPADPTLPDVQPDDQAAPPIEITSAPLPPPPGDIGPEVFEKLAPPPDQPAAVVIDEPADAVVKLRLRHVSIELGDNLLRRGRFRDAQVQFELARNAGCDPREIEIRLDRCRPFLPPPPEVVVVAPPRPRLAILDLAVIGDPNVVPPALGPWTADNLAPYFAWNYDVVDRETVCWYMGRLGLSLRDVLTDPVARRWLGRALGVRFFVVGEVRETASFVVTTHLVDAEWGYDYGWSKVHVHDPLELRWRLGDLAAETQLDPAERRRRHEEAEAVEREQKRLAELAEAQREQALLESQNVPLLVLEAQRIGDSGDLTLSIQLLTRAQQLRPDSIEVNVLFNRFKERHGRREWEDKRKQEWAAQQAALAAAKQREAALARAADEARAQAARDAAGRQAAEAQLREQQRRNALIQLQAQAQAALQQKQFDQAVQLYQTALAIRQTDELFRALAEARAKADEAARLAATQKADALQKQHEADLALARQELAKQRRAQEEKEQAERAAQEARDKALYKQLLDAARAEMAKDQFDAAISSLEAARQLERSDEVQKLLSQAQSDKAHATAILKNPAAAADLDRQLAEDKKRRDKAEAEAAHNRELYDQALKSADKALAESNYDVAEAKYQEAAKVFSTDAATVGLRKVKEGRTAAAADQARRDAEAKKDAEFHRLSDAGLAALDRKQYDQAAKLLGDADRLEPGDVNVLAALAKAQDGSARAKREADTADRDKAFHQFLDGGKANLAAKQYGAAVSALKEAVRLKPDDKDAAAALQQAEKGQADAAQTAEQQAEAKKKMDAYQKAMTDGRTALSVKQYDAAATAFGEAQKLLPGDAASAEFLKQAQKAKTDADAAVAEAAKKQAEEQQRIAAVQKALAQARTALMSHDLDAAGKALAAAADKAPNDPDVKKVEQDLQTAQAAMTADADAKKKRAEQLQALLKKGADAQAAQHFDDAVQAFTEAGRLAPDDATVKDLLAKAQKARADAQAVADQAAAKKAAEERAAKESADRLKKQQNDYAHAMAAGKTASAKGDYPAAIAAFTDAAKAMPGDKDAAAAFQGAQQAQAQAAGAEKKRQADYAAAMAAGKTALSAKKYDDAIKAFSDAGKVLPGDKDAAASLKSAQDAAAAADAAKRAEEAKKQADFAAAMTQGQTALSGKKYDDAAKAYTSALQLQPGDAKATAGLQSAQFGQHMTQGQALAAAKKFPDAVKEFEAALAIMPDNQDAKAALKRAKNNMP